jgi:hypothetical protein
MDQIHATLLGLERLAGSQQDNRNFAELRGERRDMDLAGVCWWVRQRLAEPLSIRIGGFAPYEEPFTSRGEPPWARSFSLQGDKAVLIGWPVADEQFPSSLEQLRRGAQAFGVLHRYHARRGQRDNDFYLRMGTVEDGADPHDRDNAVAAVREMLAAEPPLFTAVGSPEVSIASYVDETLPPATTRTSGLEDCDFTRLYEG